LKGKIDKSRNNKYYSYEISKTNSYILS